MRPISNTVLRRVGHAPVRSRRRGGFSLMELLTVITIASILMAILAPTLNGIMKKARMAKSQSNLHSIGQAFFNYALDHDDLLPAPQAGSRSGAARTAVGSPNLSGGPWVVEIVEYLDGAVEKSADGSFTVPNYGWPKALACPEFISKNNGIADPYKRGYGMNVYPYRADYKSPKGNDPYPYQRQKLSNLPNPSTNVLLATSNDVTIEPGTDGYFVRSGNVYSNGDPDRFEGYGLFLMLDGSVNTWSAAEAANVFSVPLNMRGQ